MAGGGAEGRRRGLAPPKKAFFAKRSQFGCLHVKGDTACAKPAELPGRAPSRFDGSESRFWLRRGPMPLLVAPVLRLLVIASPLGPRRAVEGRPGHLNRVCVRKEAKRNGCALFRLPRGSETAISYCQMIIEQCEVCLRSRSTNGFKPALQDRWHHCNACGAIYCPSCSASLEEPGWNGGRGVPDQSRICRCGSFTHLLD